MLANLRTRLRRPPGFPPRGFPRLRMRRRITASVTILAALGSAVTVSPLLLAGAPGTQTAPPSVSETGYTFVAPASRVRAGTVTMPEWQAYEDAFVTDGGRVVDTANGGISHSESQGYGMILAFAADDRPTFEAIWSFTRTNMQLRDDGLVAWRWDPHASPPITDPNNATDGDILIAYALLRAGAQWERRALFAAGRDLVRAIRKTTMVETQLPALGDATLLLPGVSGFSATDRADGPVVNPSYWIFEAFPLFSRIDPKGDWRQLAATGHRLIRNLDPGPAELPPDWVSLQDGASLAIGFNGTFGYNAIRIPLYLIRAGLRDRALLRRLRAGMAPASDSAAVVDIQSGAVVARLADPGYRAVTALIDCVLDDRAAPPRVARFTPTAYYPSTLHLLALSYMRRELPQCL